MGRDLDVQRLSTSPEGLTLLIGDSGVGKTTVLRAAQEARTDALAPRPVRVRSSPAALQLALLDALGSAVAVLSSDISVIRRTGQTVLDVAKRVGETRFDGLKAAVGKHLLDIVRARLGDSVADLLKDFTEQLKNSVDERLAARISAASDGDVIDVLVAFCGEVAALAAGRQVLLALDDADRLDDADMRRLADLVEALPDGVSIRASFTTWSAASRDAADTLEAAGARCIYLGGLDRDTVTAWLVAEGLPADLTDDVLRATSGYALAISDAIALLKAEGRRGLEALGPDSVLAARTKRSWRELDVFTQRFAASLTAFADPLAPDRAAEVLGLDLASWGAVENKLRDSGIFVPLGIPWFHELRRRCIFDEILTESQRQQAILLACQEATTQLSSGNFEPRWFVQFARLAPQHRSAYTDVAGLAAAFNADADEVALAAALIELIEPNGSEFANAETVMLYAREMFGAKDDLAPALLRLVERGLVYMASNSSHAVVTATFPNIDTARFVAGKAAILCGRLPVPMAATSIFIDMLGSHVGEFRLAQYGVGSPSIGALGEYVAALQKVDEKSGEYRIGSGNAPGLVVRATYGRTPLFAAVAHADPETRDAAIERLTGLEELVNGQSLHVKDVLAHPGNPVPSARFSLAAQILFGGKVRRNRSHLSLVSPSEDLELDVEVERRAAVLTIVRELSSDYERLAYNLEESHGYLYQGTRDNHVLAEVVGLSGASRLFGAPANTFAAKFSFFNLSHAADLADGQRIVHLTHRSHWRDEDPILAELIRLQERANRFNATQNRLTVLLDERQLETSLESSARRAAVDAGALSRCSSLGFEPLEQLYHPEYLALYFHDDDREYPIGFRSHVLRCRSPELLDRPSVSVRILPMSDRPPWSFDEVPHSLADAFGVDASRLEIFQSGSLRSIVSWLLGYEEGHVVFKHPSELLGRRDVQSQ